MYTSLLREILLDSLYGESQDIHNNAVDKSKIEKGLYWPKRAYTMIGRKRLMNFEEAIRTVIKEKIPGDILEAGVWRGGACILARGLLKELGVQDRTVFVADSFQGLPRPDRKYPADKGDKHHTFKALAVSQESVSDAFSRFDLLDSQVCFIKGFFEHSLPKNQKIKQLAVLRADGDMYSSTIQILDNLYFKVSPVGFIIIDDYGAIANCRKAVEDFRRKNSITSPLIKIDWTGVYWRKESNE